MGLLRLAVLGSPEVLHDGSHLAFSLRKAEALLLYLAVEKGLHSRCQLAPLLWPDSEPPIARKALRNALTLLRRLFADHDASPAQHTHLLISGELLGLDPQAPLELDLDVGQRVWNEIQRLPMPLTQEQRADLIAQVQYALTLVRGPLLDGFWLGESASFDEWVAQQRQQWQVRLPVLFDRLSSLQEEVGELEQAGVTLTRWMALDPLAEEASRRLMRIHLALGDPTAALRAYATCRARLAEELRVKPSEETTALAEHIRATSARHGGSPARPAAPPERRLPGEFVAPLTGRQTPFSQLVGCYQQARQGQPQAALVVGEAGIGKTRLAREWAAWAAAQGALVLTGQAFEVGGRLPYQPLVEALRPRLEAENAPEDLLEDPWLAELSRILPELRVRYPDLPAPTEDELAAKIRLFEAVARLVDALAKAGPRLLQEQTILPTLEVAHLYAHLERAYAFLHAWDQAQEASEELLAYAQRQRQPTLVGMTLNRLALLTLQQSFDKRRARALLEEAWQIAQKSSDQRVLAETEWNLAQIEADVWGDPKSALPHGQHALSLAREIHHQELEARSLLSLGWIHLLTGDLEEAIHSLEASLALYARLSHEPTASRELSVAHFLAGSPLTQPLTNRATEALCWEMLAITQAHDGQVHNSICSGRRALALAQKINNVGVQVNTTLSLTYGLLDAGVYEEALGLMQQAVALARTFPPTINFQSFLIGLGSVYQALQQWEEAHSTLEEAVAIAERLDLRPSRVPALSQLCMHYALAGEWERAYQYALKAITQRKRHAVALIVWDFSRQYETEALLRAGDLSQVRAEVHQQGERLGLYPRFRIPYLRSLATLTAWEGHSEQAVGHLREAAELAADLELPGEQWQIQAALGTLYQSSPLPDTARTAFGEAARIIQRLAQGIKDERLRTRFLAGPPIQRVIKSHARLS